MSAATPLLEVLAPLGLEARALRQGLGDTARARRLAASSARTVAVAGVCGALDAALRPGDVLVASELRADGQRLECSEAPALQAALRAAGIRAEAVTLVCVDHLVRGREREELAASGARAVDMESLWLAEAAGARPWAVLRVVVDGPGHELLRPGSLLRGWRALGALRRAAPALEAWARGAADAKPEEVS